MKSIFLIIIFSNLLLSVKQLIRLDYHAQGRYGFECFDSLNCITLDWEGPDHQLVYKSIDRGESWFERSRFTIKDPSINIIGNLKEGFILDSNSYYFTNEYQSGVIYWTHDGGETYNSSRCNMISGEHKIFMFDSLRGIINHESHIIYTYDGWMSWSIWSSLEKGSVLGNFDAARRSDSTVYISAKKFIGEKSFDHVYEFNINSLEYKPIYTFPDVFGHYMYNRLMKFFNKDTGFILGSIKREHEYQDTDIIYKTTDGGKTWRIVLEEFHRSYWLKDIDFASDGQYGLAIDGSKYYETFDGGETWHYGYHVIENARSHVYCQVAFVGDRCLIGSMGNGMWAWEEVTSVSIEDIGNLKVWQSGSTFRIGSDINELQINIFDLQGNKVNTEHFNKNTIIDLSDKPSGTYLFNIIHQNLIVKSGKLSVVN